METIAAQIRDTVQQRGRATLDDVVKALPSEKRDSVKAILARLVREGELRRVEKGVYEVVEPLPPEGLQLYADVERLMHEMAIVELKLLKRGAGRFQLRDSVSEDIGKLRTNLSAARRLANKQPQNIKTHLTIAADMLEARANEVQATIEKLEKSDPRPASPLRGGRGRPAKYSE